MFGEPGARSPHEEFYEYYAGGQLQAVRDRQWKLHFPHTYRSLSGRKGGTEGMPVPYDQQEIGLELFDLKHDVGETTNVASQHPEVVRHLQSAAERARRDLGDRLSDRTGQGVRAIGQLEESDERLVW